MYREHETRVYSLALRMVGFSEAEELTQDVFVRAWQKLHTFRGDAAFSTWLHRLAVNVFLGHLRSRKRDRDRFARSEPQVDRASVPPVRAETRIDLEAAMEELPEGARQVFVLHDIEGFKHNEIATMLGVAAGTSKSQLHRARSILREQLSL